MAAGDSGVVEARIALAEHNAAIISQLEQMIESQRREITELRQRIDAVVPELGVSNQTHLKALLSDLQGQVDRRIETQLRELEEVRKRSDERLSALDLRISAIFTEQHRATRTAEEEREKTAAAMRQSLAISIKEGDDRLREHILQQINQINLALEAADRLETARVMAAERLAESVRRELGLIVEASKDAIAKAERSQKEVNEKSNEFRAQLGDQARTLYPRAEAESRQVEVNRRIELLERGYPNLLTRTQFENTINEWATWRARVEIDLASKQGAETALQQRVETQQPWMIWLAGGVVTVIIAVIVIAVNLLTAV